MAVNHDLRNVTSLSVTSDRVVLTLASAVGENDMVKVRYRADHDGNNAVRGADGSYVFSTEDFVTVYRTAA